MVLGTKGALIRVKVTENPVRLTCPLVLKVT